MFIIERKDGEWFNVSRGAFFHEIPEGLVIEVTGDDMVIIKDWDRKRLEKETEWYQGGLVVRQAEWRVYPDGEYCP